MQYIEGNSVWIKLVPKTQFRKFGTWPGFAGERPIWSQIADMPVECACSFTLVAKCLPVLPM